jgi:hypothetical protein
MDWFTGVLNRMATVKPGSTRKALLEVFAIEGGLSTGLQRTYVSRDCAYFKVDVEFQAVGRPNRDEAGRVTLVEDDQDIIVKILRQPIGSGVTDELQCCGVFPVVSMNVICCLLLNLTSFAAVRCPEPNPSWVVDDDRVDGVVSTEGRPLKHAEVQLFDPTQDYGAITDAEGAFLIPNVAVGSYSFVVKGWGKAHLEVRGWHRGKINRPVLLFNSTKRCLLLTLVSN